MKRVFVLYVNIRAIIDPNPSNYNDSITISSVVSVKFDILRLTEQGVIGSPQIFFWLRLSTHQFGRCFTLHCREKYLRRHERQELPLDLPFDPVDHITSNSKIIDQNRCIRCLELDHEMSNPVGLVWLSIRIPRKLNAQRFFGRWTRRFLETVANIAVGCSAVCTM